MRTGNIARGLVLVFIGVMLLLANFHVITINWHAVMQLWPLLFIIGGANIMLSGKAGFAPVLAVVITVAALAFAGWYGTQPQSDNWGWDGKQTRNFEIHRSPRNSSFTAPYQDTVKKAKLTISGGATVYKLKDTTSNLFDADVNYQWGNYSLRNTSKEGMEMLVFSMNSHGREWSFDGDGNEAVMRLNKNPVWDIQIETGAGETDLDLKPFKVNSLTFKGGAASFEAELGEPDSLTTITAETGAAEVDIKIPASAGCRIEVQSGLSSRDFDGFTKQPDGSYTTNNYHSSPRKFHIYLKGGLSDFQVKRY